MNGDLIAVLREQFALREGEDPAEFIRLLGGKIRRLEDAFDSDIYLCPECGKGEYRATVLDSLIGAVYIEGSCCLVDDERVSAAALERHRLAQLLGTEDMP